MSLTTTKTTTTGGGSSLQPDQLEKGWLDFLGDVLPAATGFAAQAVGIDPRVAGQTVSQVMHIFGVGKDFSPTVAKDEALAQLQQVVGPHLADPGFAKALGAWMQAAIEPVQAQKEGKAYQPSVDLSKSWFDDAIGSIGDAVSSVNWGQVAQVGMQALPLVLSVL